ncbi:hypothetical protein RISK_001079 [Rhodopirellula islandica]|uniref:Uncharacterized protein n=1 Tax=Rhodopirellula islandica TaxID=595434 RepID=A0A0J1BJN1_RHOIS|nr:hypothetical protein RISK_001079 [Rhodopirellula islandica]
MERQIDVGAWSLGEGAAATSGDPSLYQTQLTHAKQIRF